MSGTAIGYSITFYIKVVVSDWRLTPKRRKCLAHNGGGRECLTPQAGGAAKPTVCYGEAVSDVAFARRGGKDV
jgi:hypothetical protein